MSSKIYIKRTSVAGKIPTTAVLNTGELGLNLKDGRMYSSDGTAIFEIGANVESLSVGTGAFSIANGAMTFPSDDAASSGQSLLSHANGILYWGTPQGLGLQTETDERILRSSNSVHVLLDTDNDSSAEFTVRKNANTVSGSAELFKVEENGRVHINNNYSFPTTDGAANGEVLLTYANGTLYWGSPSAGGITVEGAQKDKVLRSNGSFYVLIDTDNDDSSSIFQIRKDTNVTGFGDNIFEVRSDGRAKINDSYTLPNYDGNNGEALVTDGSGGLSWGSVASSDDLNDILSRGSDVNANVFFNADTTANNFFVEGDLIVSGNVTTISSEELNVDTNFIVLNANLTSTIAPLLDAGIEVNRGSSANTKLYWDESGNRWHVTYGNALTDRKIPITLDDVLDNGFASNNNITVNGIARFEDVRATELTINNDYSLPSGDGNRDQVLATYGNGSLYWAVSNNELRTSIGYSAMNFTANTGQQIFSGVDDDGVTLRYEVGKTSVYLNGIKLKLGIDYSATTGTSITLSEEAANGDILMVDCFGYQTTMQFGDASIEVGTSYSAANSTQQVIDSFNTTDFTSAQILVQATENGKVHLTTVNLIHAFNTVQISEFGTLQSNGSLMELDATSNNSVVSLLATPVSPQVEFKIHRTSLRG